MESEKFLELKDKVDKLCKELVKTKKDNARLNRLLLAAEAKLKKKSVGNGGGDHNVLELAKQVEKFRNERKMIRAKVEKMSAKLEKFYGDKG